MNIGLFSLLGSLDNFLWGYAALPAILFMGIYLTCKSRCLQIRRFPQIIKYFFQTLTIEHHGHGVHPLKAFFVSIGGCMGVGNVVAVCTAIQVGGPGALLWIWITALVGMILKYSEVYLGMRYRAPDGKGGYRGGPMYYLKKAYKQAWIPKLVCFLLCIYGVEIYQFCVVTENISTNFEINKYSVALLLISLIIITSRKGVNHIGSIAAIFIPAFIVCYLGMSAYVFIQNINLLPAVLKSIVESAFTGHAALGAFVGSGILLTASQGIRRSCYAGDIAVGYASVIHSETVEAQPEKQAKLAIVEIFLDSFIICTTSVMLVLTTDVWNKPIEASMLVQEALSGYFPAMDIFMPLFLLLLGFTTIVSYFCSGIKCAEFMSPVYGRKVFYVYACCSSLLFVSLQTNEALTVISITAALLLMLNLYGIFRLRHEIDFLLPSTETSEMASTITTPCLQVEHETT